MDRRKLGNSGMEVAPLALGGNVFGWTVDEPMGFRILDAFVAAGFNLIDTADVYSRWVPGNQGGESETMIGKWLKRSGKRKKVILATKVGMDMGPKKKGLSKAYILRAVEDSLRRLQTDYIDLYQSHGRSEDAAGGNSGGLCAVGEAGESAGDRRFQLRRGAAGRGAGGQPAAGISRLPEPSASLQSL